MAPAAPMRGFNKNLFRFSYHVLDHVVVEYNNRKAKIALRTVFIITSPEETVTGIFGSDGSLKQTIAFDENDLGQDGIQSDGFHQK